MKRRVPKTRAARRTTLRTTCAGPYHPGSPPAMAPESCGRFVAKFSYADGGALTCDDQTCSKRHGDIRPLQVPIKIRRAGSAASIRTELARR